MEMRKMAVLSFMHVICFTLITVSCTQKRAVPDRSYSSLITALCTEEDGTVKKVCLQNISTSRLIEEIYTRIANDRLAKQRKKEPFNLEREVIGEDSIPDKRARESNSGFYSNW